MELSTRPGLAKIESRIVGYFIIICGLLVVAVSYAQAADGPWRQVAIFAVLSFLSLLMPTRLPEGANFSVAFILDLILIAVFGSPITIVVRFTVTLLAGLLSRLLGRDYFPFEIIKMTCEDVLVVGLAGTVYQIIGGGVFSFVIAAAGYFLCYTFFAALDRLIAAKQEFAAKWIALMRSVYIYYLVLSPLGYLLTSLVRETTLQWKLFGVLLFFVPVMLVSHSFRLFINIRQSYLTTVKTMVKAIEAKDPYMKGHSEHVAELALAVAKELRMHERELRKLEYVALLHDAGKIGVPEGILNKAGTLSMEEYEEVKKHSALGADIVGKIKFLSAKSDVVLHHHERYDGTGYPAGLRGENIPLEARILAVADAYDAMITDRPFRPAKTSQQAVEEMEQSSGTQFDPRLVKIFKTVLTKRREL